MKETRSTVSMVLSIYTAPRRKYWREQTPVQAIAIGKNEVLSADLCGHKLGLDELVACDDSIVGLEQRPAARAQII